MITLTDVDLAWLAGLLEGEGCFSLDKGIYPRVYLRMTDEDVVERAHQIVGVGNTHFSKQQGLGWKPTYCWQVNHEAVELMTILKPHMGIRRQQRIEEVLAIHEARNVTPKTWKSGAWKKEKAELAANGQKRCARCREVKPVDEFYFDQRAGTTRGHCKGCH